MALTLWGKNYDSYHLRRVAGELENSLKQLDDVSETTIIGGQPQAGASGVGYAATGRLWPHSGGGCGSTTACEQPECDVGSFARDNNEFKVEAGRFFTRTEDLQQVVVGIHSGHPVYLRDVVEKLEDGPSEPDSYVMFANASGSSEAGRRSDTGQEYPAVTITLAKRKGTNATINLRTCSGESSTPCADMICPTT